MNKEKNNNSELAIEVNLHDLTVTVLFLCQIEHGASPDCRDDQNMTPLTRAVEKGAKNVAKFFFEVGQCFEVLQY